MTSFEELLKTMEAKGLSLGSVESLTGGLFAATVCSIPGASHVFMGSLVTYDPREKIALANVKKESIDELGVVSEQVAREMARGGKNKLNVDVCVSCTGNAGPTTCPGYGEVGDVYVAISSPKDETCIKLSLKGSRNEIREKVVEQMAEAIIGTLANI
ncbi:MAG: CinA family protein [Bacilli bacterium]|nr:CinA family protein [Bacilli bacterium]